MNHVCREDKVFRVFNDLKDFPDLKFHYLCSGKKDKLWVCIFAAGRRCCAGMLCFSFLSS